MTLINHPPIHNPWHRFTSHRTRWNVDSSFTLCPTDGHRLGPRHFQPSKLCPLNAHHPLLVYPVDLNWTCVGWITDAA